MAVLNGPKCKKCRRAGKKLFLKADRCNTAKCAMVKRNFPPGAHGPTSHTRMTTYGIQHKEKQKAKIIYGVLEKQFKTYFDKATGKKGDTAITLTQMLESRLDNTLFRSGFAKSRKIARQLIGHNHILVNNKKMNIPSFDVKVGDIISLKHDKIGPFKELKEQLAKAKGYSWLVINPDKFEIKIADKPNVEEIAGEFDPKLITEFYSR